MAKAVQKEKMNTGNLIAILLWFVGIIVTLSVGSGMIQHVLVIPYVPEIVTEIAGWTVVVISIIGVVLEVFSK